MSRRSSLDTATFSMQRRDALEPELRRPSSTTTGVQRAHGVELFSPRELAGIRPLADDLQLLTDAGRRAGGFGPGPLLLFAHVIRAPGERARVAARGALELELFVQGVAVELEAIGSAT
jgi:hypothetical protein